MLIVLTDTQAHTRTSQSEMQYTPATKNREKVLNNIFPSHETVADWRHEVCQVTEANVLTARSWELEAELSSRKALAHRVFMKF